MIRLRSSTFARRAMTDNSSFSAASPGSAVHRWIERACTVFTAVMLGGSSTLLACPMCFGAEETSMVDGTKVGVLVMLAITLVVQGGFAGFFLYLRKRAKRIADIELEAEWSELQGSRTS
jgi:hypothetical protein